MPEAATAEARPSRWDLSNVFSGLEADDYRSGCAELVAALDGLEAYFDEHHVRRTESPATAVSPELNQLLADLLTKTNEVIRRYSTLRAFVFSYFSTDSYNAVAQREISKLEKLGVRFNKLSVRLEAWIGSHAALIDDLLGGSDIAKDHEFTLRWSAKQSQYLMSEELEALAAELVVDGGSAFGKLQGVLTSQLKMDFDSGNGKKSTPVTVIQNHRFSSDGMLRKRAYEAEIKAWESVKAAIAASLNAVKGTAITLAKRRGRDSVLDAALDRNKIDRATLDAMMGAIEDHFPTFRRYLNAKAKKLRKSRLSWWDIQAPVGGDEMTFSWREARDFIVEKFGTFTGELGEYAATAFDQNWIDGEPREGKRGGAFCMPVVGVDQSRILVNFDGSFDQVSTLAHELGHGFHNHCQSGLPALLRGAPSTLAETASIFCETLVAEAALKSAETDGQKLSILEAQIGGATQVCLDISSRFRFEQAIIEKRADSELSPDEFCDLMKQAQKETYGEAVDPATYHPFMWVWKPHYYSHEHNFYNFPYAFGHLFGLGLYAVYQQEGDAFVGRYRELLRSTNMDTAAPLANRFGIDIAKKDFWLESLKVVEEQVARYEELKG